MRGERDKVAIVGFARPSREEAPYDDQSWEIWGVNDGWTWIKRADRWFEPHSAGIFEWEMRRSPGHVDWLRQFAGPVYLIERREDIPSSVTYPLAEVARSIGRPYLTSGIAYMLALAIHEGFRTIGLWGVEMAYGSEYQHQRPCVEWLLGLAEGRGVKIVLPEKCPILTGPLYARGDLNPGGERITRQQLKDRWDALQRDELTAANATDNALGTLKQIEGAKKALRDLMGVMPEQGNAIKARMMELDEQERAAKVLVQQHRANLDMVRGAQIECKHWIGLTPEGASPAAVAPPRAADEPIRLHKAEALA